MYSWGAFRPPISTEVSSQVPWIVSLSFAGSSPKADGATSQTSARIGVERRGMTGLRVAGEGFLTWLKGYNGNVGFQFPWNSSGDVTRCCRVEVRTASQRAI